MPMPCPLCNGLIATDSSISIRRVPYSNIQASARSCNHCAILLSILTEEQMRHEQEIELGNDVLFSAVKDRRSTGGITFSANKPGGLPFLFKHVLCNLRCKSCLRNLKMLSANSTKLLMNRSKPKSWPLAVRTLVQDMPWNGRNPRSRHAETLMSVVICSNKHLCRIACSVSDRAMWTTKHGWSLT